jgi:N-acetylglucosamine-6-phosphate deacetylase
LPPAVVKSFVRGKTAERVVLVSDMTGMGGMSPGRYDTSLGAVEVLENGKLVVAGQRDLLAGAALSIEHGVANVMRFAGVDLRAAVEMASVRPAELIGVRTHHLEVGAAANLVVFEMPADANQGPLRILQTLVA